MTNFLSFLSGVGVTLFGGKMYILLKEKLQEREARATVIAGDSMQSGKTSKPLRRAPYRRGFIPTGEVICMTFPRHPVPKQWKLPKTSLTG